MPTSQDPPRNIIVLVNILAPDHDRLSTDVARAEIGEDAVLDLVHLEERLPLPNLEGRQWRRLARTLDELVEQARTLGEQAGPGEVPVQYVVMGRAPLPVFAYLGQRMRRMNGPIVVVNQTQGTHTWDHVGKLPPLEGAGEAPAVFDTAEPEVADTTRGTFALSIRCSTTHKYDEPQIRSLVVEGTGPWLGCYSVAAPRRHQDDPLSVEDLPELLQRVDEAQGFISAQAPTCASLLVAFAGPAWAAFWIGHRLNPQVCGRIDLPNYAHGHGYRPALASPMAGVPLLEREARISLLAAEPEDQLRTAAARAFKTVRRRVEGALGRDTPYAFAGNESAQVDELTRELREHQPHILHLWVHGTAGGELVFNGMGDDDRSVKITGPQFAALLLRAETRPTLLVLCACHLDKVAPVLLEVAECVVAMTDEVNSQSAIAFCSAFYEMLAGGSTLADAFAEGKFQANIARPVKPELFQIHYTDGLDGGKVSLFAKPRRPAKH